MSFYLFPIVNTVNNNHLIVALVASFSTTVSSIVSTYITRSLVICVVSRKYTITQIKNYLKHWKLLYGNFKTLILISFSTPWFTQGSCFKTDCSLSHYGKEEKPFFFFGDDWILAIEKMQMEH